MDLDAGNVWFKVPCDRIIRSDFRLSGYGGGVDVKHEILKT